MRQKRKENQAGAHAAPGQVRRRRSLAWFCCCGLLLSAAAILALGMHPGPRETQRPRPASLAELLALSHVRRAQVPLAELNLLCATGLCPASEPDVQACDATLQSWAARVRSETKRHQYRFERNPAQFENSQGYFRMLMLCVVLAEDFGIHYDAQRQAGPDATRADDGFFADASSVFLHGLLGSKRKGTCSSLPVLYVAVGRHLGYPLELVTTRGHLFVRWEGEGERFNVEATARGLSRFDDDYYRHWPFEISPAEETAEGYLKSLTAPEEFAVFLSIRGMCLREQGRLGEAAAAFASAARFAPGCASYRRMQQSLENRLSATATQQSPNPSNSKRKTS